MRDREFEKEIETFNIEVLWILLPIALSIVTSIVTVLLYTA